MANTSRASIGPSDRKIRLKNLLDKGNALGVNVEAEDTVETINAIKNIISESDEIIGEGNVGDRAEHTAEVVMDAQLLKMSHQLVAKVMEASTDFNDVIYQNAIASLVFRDDNTNWNALTDIASGICLASKFSASLLGCFDTTIPESMKPVKEKLQRKKKTTAEELEPEKLSQLEKQDKGAKKVKIILNQITKAFEENKRCPIPFFKLIIDPNSFMNTIENAFQLAFLARDGIVAIETGEDDNMPHVRVTTSGEKELVTQSNQSVCSINLELCKEMIVFYNIEEAMLKVGGT